MKKTSAIILVVVLVLGGAAVALFRPPDAPGVVTAAKATPPAPLANSQKPAPSPRIADAPVPPTPPPPAPLSPAADSESAETRLQAQLRATLVRGYIGTQLGMVVAKSKLSLSDSEQERLLDIVLDCRHAEAMIDAPLARMVSFDGATLVLEIPPHAEQGATVKTVFGQQLQKEFSPERASEMLRALDANLGRLFDGFGKFHQTFTVEKPREDGQVHVTMTAKALATQGPADPALVELADSISGGGWFSREILDMAHESIVPAVDKYFPKGAAPP
jgi:hypothetical protein